MGRESTQGKKKRYSRKLVVFSLLSFLFFAVLQAVLEIYFHVEFGFWLNLLVSVLNSATIMFYAWKIGAFGD